MTALAEILRWSADRPMWQRDALRRLVLQPSLSNSDLEQIMKNCKVAHLLANPQELTPDAILLTAADIPPSAAAETVEIAGVGDVRNVNALADGERIGFGSTGITVIYGNNASGKSGYARVLKQLCRARARGGPIISNVFGKQLQEPPSARVDYRVGGAARRVQWVQGQTPPPELASVYIFDSECASVHVEETNELFFTPFGLDLLGKLAGVCQEVQNRLRQEVAMLEQTLPSSLREPQAAEGTEVRRQIGSLNADSNLEDFRRLATLSKQEQAKLRDLRRALAGDPAALAKEIRVRQGRLAQLGGRLKSLAELVSDDSAGKIKGLLADATAKEQTAALAAKATFGNQPLPGIGGEVWRELWESARKYSESAAYPDLPFPATEDEARCVLCQQLLSPEAAARLKQFEKFIQSDTRKKAETARRAVEGACQTLQATPMRTRDFSGPLKDLGLEDEELLAKTRRFLIQARLRRRGVIHSCAAGTWAELSLLPENPSPQVDELARVLAARADNLERATHSEERANLTSEANELEARQWLAGILDDVASDILRRQRLRALAAAITEANTAPITRKETDLVHWYITDALIDRFSEEVKLLGAGHLHVCLRSAGGHYGHHRFKIQLDGARQAADVADVLSDGEFRCIALAAFLAELATAEGHSALVFDDPVCSLDHRWQRRVAKRLAVEATTRQIIVMTHDIAFLMSLRDECHNAEVQLQEGYVRRTELGAGVSKAGAPWIAMKVKEQIGYLKNELQSARAIFSKRDSEQYERLGRSIYSLLRATWERAVEEVLLNQVVMRFGYTVQTRRLKPLTDIRPEDVMQIEKAMDKCSRITEAHDQPGAVNEPVPQPDELASDLDELEAWVETMRKRDRK